MAKTPILKPQWLDIISCCGAKTQLSIISAIVKYQADGTIPDFKGIKLALFLALVQDIDPQTDTTTDDQDETPTENDTNDDTPMSPKRRNEITKEYLAYFYSSGMAEVVLKPFHILRNEYPFLLSRAIRTNPPSDECLSSVDKFLSYLTDLTREIDHNIREGGSGF